MTANLHAPRSHPAPGSADRAAAATPSWYPCTSSVNAAAGVARCHPRLHEMLVVRLVKRASKHELLSDSDFAVRSPGQLGGATATAPQVWQPGGEEGFVGATHRQQMRVKGLWSELLDTSVRSLSALRTADAGSEPCREAPEPVSLPTRILKVSDCARLLPFRRHPSSNVRTVRRALHTATLSRASNYTNGPPRPG